MADAERPGSAARSLLKRLGMAAGVLVFGVAPWFLYRELRSFHPREIADDIRGFPGSSILLAAAATVLRYLAASAHKWLAERSARMMLWCSSRGYRWFNLGVAPLAGLPPHELASLWSRAANILTHRGGRFYNFAGLRSFKEKFDPVWEPRSIAAPRGIALPLIVAR
ncbi:MAG: phosphatidylglycerol lysyltransferase domain-containing protein [Spirochaetes bacterium]|nr:phosphatidylglycerol lysyltransferase domain-containing protein [Spirochaetota bacterium]